MTEEVQRKPRSYEILGIIPARGQSTRIPGKNIKLLAGKPLIAYTIEAAQHSKYLTRVVVATDDDDVAKVAHSYGVEVVINPPALHTGDEQGIINVVNHTLAYLERYGGYKPLIVVLLQPTSPLRTTEDIDSTIRLMLDQGAESSETQCQGKENGAVYVSRRQVWTEQKKVLGFSLAVYEMPVERSIDINTQEDFDRASEYLSKPTGGILAFGEESTTLLKRVEKQIKKKRKAKRGRK